LPGLSLGEAEWGFSVTPFQTGHVCPKDLGEFIYQSLMRPS
ncbi:hypothetical protein Tco_0356101, partial [Tanacetum coccineum]